MWQIYRDEIASGIAFLENHFKTLSLMTIIGIVLIVVYVFGIFKPYYLVEQQLEEKRVKELLILQTSNIIMQIEKPLQTIDDIVEILNQKYIKSNNIQEIRYKMRWYNYDRKSILFTAMGDDREQLIVLMQKVPLENNASCVDGSLVISEVKGLSRIYLLVLGMVVSILGSVLWVLGCEYYKGRKKNV